MNGKLTNEVIKPAGAFGALGFVKGLLEDNNLINDLVVLINQERDKLGNNDIINASKLRENLTSLSKSLHSQLAGHLDKWIQNGLTVEPANSLPKAGA